MPKQTLMVVSCITYTVSVCDILFYGDILVLLEVMSCIYFDITIYKYNATVPKCDTVVFITAKFIASSYLSVSLLY